MLRPLPIKTILGKLRVMIDARISRGDFDKFGQRPELHQLNSIIFSDLRACLLRRASIQKSLGSTQADMFTIKQLEEIAKADGETPQAALRRAYVEAATEAARR